jgi:hypothetical protein
MRKSLATDDGVLALLRGDVIVVNGAILVRGSWKFSDYGFAYLFASLGLIGAFIAFVVGHAWVVALFALVPLGCALAIAWDVARKNRSRRWVRDLGDGIVVIDRGAEFRVADSDFLAMALILKEQYYQGQLQSHLRRFIIWTKADDTRRGKIEMTNTIAQGSTDPLMSLIQRVSDLLF